MAATEAAFAARVAWTMVWMISFMYTFGDGARDRKFGIGARDRTWGVWGAGVVRARAAKAGAEEATGWSRWAGYNMVPRLQEEVVGG